MLHVLHSSERIAIDDLKGICWLVQCHREYGQCRHCDDTWVITEDVAEVMSSEDKSYEDE